MNVTNNFDEDFSAPYEGDDNGRVGYLREEVSFGWRLPPTGEQEVSLRDFVMELVSDGTENANNVTQYKSPTTDVAAWVAEIASGRDLKRHLSDIVCGAGLEHGFSTTLDCNAVPVLSSGGSMTCRDLARYGLLFARGGLSVLGEKVGSGIMIRETLQDNGTWLDEVGAGRQYHNNFMIDSETLTHSGYGGQFLAVHPNKGIVIAFLSVLENHHGVDESHAERIVTMVREIMRWYDGDPRTNSA